MSGVLITFTLSNSGGMQLSKQMEDQEHRILALDGELKAMRIAQRFIEAGIKSKTVNLTQMKDALVRMKASVKGKEQYHKYKQAVREMKGQLKEGSENKLQKEINEMELKGMI